MDLLNKLTKKNLKLNKKRTIVTIVGIILSVSLITAVSTMYMSLIKSLISYEKQEKGNYHVVFYDVPSEDLETIKNHRDIENIYIVKNMGYAKVDGIKNESKPYVQVKGLTLESLNNLAIKLVSGRLPENNNEIVIPTHLKTNGRLEYNIGDEITLDVGTRVVDECKLDRYNPYTENERLTNISKKKYKIVGIIERPDANIESFDDPGYSFITIIENEDIVGNVDVYSKYTKKGAKNYYNATGNIVGIDGNLLKKFDSQIDQEEYDLIINELSKVKYTYDINKYLIILETKPLSDSALGGLSTVACIVCIIIVFTSVFCIKNSFDISITEKTKQYGMLKSIGATKKQIRKNVFYEATILGLISIPLGILLGFLASFILIIITNYYLTDMVAATFKIRFSFSLLAILISIILSIITIYLSAFKSAYRASKVSPIESILNSSNIKIKAKKIKSPKIINRLFGIGGDISYKNIKRNRKKYRTTIISIFVSVFVFIALSSFMTIAFDAIKHEYSTTDYTLALYESGRPTKEKYESIIKTTKLDNIDDYSIQRTIGSTIVNPKYSKQYLKWNTDKSIKFDLFEILALGEEPYKKYLDKLGLDYEYAKDKIIIVNSVEYSYFEDQTGKLVRKTIDTYDYKKGDKIKLNVNLSEKDYEFVVANITDVKPFAYPNTNNTCICIVSDELYESIGDNEFKYSVNLYFKSSNTNKLQDDIEKILDEDDYSTNNVYEDVTMVRNFYTLVAIFLYGFIIVISLIGITNIFNTITTSMELRKQEFAMLKSIGMTNNEFNRMIRLESVFMCSKSLIFGIPLGIIISYIIYYKLGKNIGLKYHLPITAVVISILTVFILITIIMKYSINKINKQNTIETIRNENI